MKLVLSILLILLVHSVHAEEVTIPASCKPVTIQGESVMLSAKNPLLVIIHNVSNTDLWITHPVSEPSTNAGWSSHLQAGNWSALVLDKESFELSCIESKPGHEQQVPCNGVVSVCQWSKATMTQEAAGTYWAGENMTLAALMSHLGSRGIVLPTSSQ